MSVKLTQDAEYEWRVTDNNVTISKLASMDVTVPVSSTTGLPSPKEKNTEPCP